MEQQNNEEVKETKPKQKTNIGSLILLIGLLLIFAGVAMITFTPQEVEQSENPEQTEQPSEESSSGTNNKLGQTIELSKETEDITFDSKLRIKFIGTASADMEGAYKYKAEIYLNNELVNHNFYTGSNIYSKDYAANFTVYKIENTYIIHSFIAAQCGGADVLVLTEDRTVMTPYSNVTLEVYEDSQDYIVTKCSDCMNTSSCQKTKVNIPKLTK